MNIADGPLSLTVQEAGVWDKTQPVAEVPEEVLLERGDEKMIEQNSSG